MVLLGGNAKESASQEDAESDEPAKEAVRKPSVADYLAGEARDVIGTLNPHLPNDMIGGSIPHIPGTEDESVWNAASQACGTEKVHFCYSVDDKRVWYLACPSSSMSSNPDSWCPLASALPGKSEFWDKETVYLYEQEGQAAALRWDPETGRMQVYLGASRTILPRIQTMDANFVTINPQVAEVVPWKNMALRTEKLSRATARTLVLTGLVVNAIIVAILAFQYFATHWVQRDLNSVKMQTQEAVNSLMLSAASTMQSDTIRHMVRIQELLDDLSRIDGTLVRYEVNGSSVEWEALIPQAYSGGASSVQGQVQPEIEKDGRVRMIGRR